MKDNNHVIWKIKIPKRLKNKINYYIKKAEMDREYFFNTGTDFLGLRHMERYDTPEPKNMYRFSEKDEAELVTWQLVLTEGEAEGYKKFIEYYGVSERDILAAALYYNLVWIWEKHFDSEEYYR